MGTKALSYFTNEQMVEEYFGRIDSQDLAALADLFDYDAVLHEPFSNIEGGLRGREQIVHFLKVVLMANRGLKRKIEFKKDAGDSIDAHVTYERGDKIRSKLHFEFSGGRTSPR